MRYLVSVTTPKVCYSLLCDIYLRLNYQCRDDSIMTDLLPGLLTLFSGSVID